MGEYTVWYNPSCSKSRGVRDQFDDLGESVVYRLYRDDPPTHAELVDVLDKLGLEPWDICRFSEEEAQERNMAQWPRDAANRSKWIETMCAVPRLIQRPIVIRDDRAVVAREVGWRVALDE